MQTAAGLRKLARTVCRNEGWRPVAVYAPKTRKAALARYSRELFPEDQRNMVPGDQAIESKELLAVASAETRTILIVRETLEDAVYKGMRTDGFGDPLTLSRLLLHELAHIGGGIDHGKMWRDCLNRLVAQYD